VGRGGRDDLEDLDLLYDAFSPAGEPADDLTLTPSSTPPLGGQLRLTNFKRVALLKDMIELFGGIRFHYMDLHDVEGMPLLLGACAKTLKTLLLWPSDPRATTSLADFDLSRLKSLRTIQVAAWSIDRALSNGTQDTASSILKQALSTIRAPSFFEVVVLYRWYDFRGVESSRNSDQPPLRYMSQAEEAEETSRHHRRFDLLRGVHNLRDFRLVLSAGVWDPVGEYSVRMLKEAIVAEKARGGFDGYLSEPFVTYYPRRSRV